MTDHLFFILGADRVGKSTYVQNFGGAYTELSRGSSYMLHRFHFDGPKPWHNSPIDQYIEKLSPVLKDPATDPSTENIYLCDRGGSEVCFYEKYRRGVDIDISWAQSFESWCLSNFHSVNVVLLEKDWGGLMESRHLKEIDALWQDSSAWYRQQQLMSREAEHKAYYSYMRTYLLNSTLLPSTSISFQTNNELFDIKHYLKRIL